MKRSATRLLSELPGTCYLALGFLVIAGLGYVDLMTGREFRLSVFYLAPVFLVTWKAGLKSGIAVSVAAASAETVSDLMAGLTYSHPAIFYWNALIETLSFIVVAMLTWVLKKAYEREKTMARSDLLTGIANRQTFIDRVENEGERSRRYGHPLTIVYIDCDDFKTVNDTFGHQTGDAALRTVAETMVNTLRSTDTAARLGGDEFGILLPETGDQAAAEAVTKIQRVLLDAMEKNGWRITFSIGVATFASPAHSADEMLSRADALMYGVKNGSKNMMKCATY